MARIRAKDTRPEVLLRRRLWVRGLRYRLHVSTPVGKPDIVFPRVKVAVFVDGCFWHGCPEHYVRPRSSGEFWADKLAANVRRDRKQTKRLEGLGWTVLRIWEHEAFEEPDRVAERVAAVVRGKPARGRPVWRVCKVVEIDSEANLERRYMCDLRDASRRRTITQRRSTGKWRSRTQ